MSRKNAKKALRIEIIKKREALGEKARQEASWKITGKLSGLARSLGWGLISSYLGFDGEVQTEDFLHRCRKEGIRTAVPYIFPGSKRLYFSEIKDFHSELRTNRYGIKEPKRRFLRLIPTGAFDAIIVPGTLFDRQGHRLGYGLGFYDRALVEVQGKVLLIGLAFSLQMTERLPVEEHDIHMDLVITEEKIYRSKRDLPARLEDILFEEVLRP